MILYTIQDISVYEQLIQNGVAYCEVQSDFAKDNMDAYQWMCEQMTERIGAPEKKGVLPIWAWYQYVSKKRPRPILDKYDNIEHSVLLKIEVPESEVLLSDFELWHYVLNKFDISGRRDFLRRRINKLEHIAGKYLTYAEYPVDIQAEVRQSWCRIFDLYNRDAYYAPKAKRNRAIQATLWCLRKEQIKEVTFF